ncbi:MAG: hypothetical protein Q9217_006182 [Psora testacea]
MSNLQSLTDLGTPTPPHKTTTVTKFSADKRFPAASIPAPRGRASGSTIIHNEEYLMSKLEAVKAAREPEYQAAYERKLRERARERFLASKLFRQALEAANAEEEWREGMDAERRRKLSIEPFAPELGAEVLGVTEPGGLMECGVVDGSNSVESNQERDQVF